MEVKNNTPAFMNTPPVTSNIHISNRGTLPGKYHQDEIQMHSMINKTAIVIISVGFALICEVINSSSNQKFQEKMIEKLVDTYCENKKKG